MMITPKEEAFRSLISVNDEHLDVLRVMSSVLVCSHIRNECFYFVRTQMA